MVNIFSTGPNLEFSEYNQTFFRSSPNPEFVTL